MGKDEGAPTQDAPTQGKAVEKALKGERNRDIDRWAGFSEKEAAETAAAPAPPEGAEKPRAGLARDGGQVEGEG